MNEPAYAGIVKIAGAVLQKTNGGSAVWQNDGQTLSLCLPTVTVSISKEKKEDKSSYLIAIALPDGKKIDQVVALTSDPNYALFQSLHESASRAWWSALGNSVQKLVFDSETIGVSTTTKEPTTTTTAPELPTRPTSEQAFDLFEHIAGDWHLDYSRGQEDIHISADGNLFTLSTNRGKVPLAMTRPTFRLELLACNSTSDQVEIAKVEPNGKTRQIEVLTISETAMTGYAKHDGHKLKYTRR